MRSWTPEGNSLAWPMPIPGASLRRAYFPGSGGQSTRSSSSPAFRMPCSENGGSSPTVIPIRIGWFLVRRTFCRALWWTRYDSCLVIQALTAGIDSLLEPILTVLLAGLEPEGVYLRNDASARELEGLPKEKRVLWGNVSETVTARLDGLKFLVDIVNGQKTGFYLDQDFNRSRLRQYLFSGARVLDLFSYTGAWGYALHTRARARSPLWIRPGGP